MISLTCNNCRAVLNIDDAFAGGACRCQHCGTIQTVPSHLKRGTRPGDTTQAGKESTGRATGEGDHGSEAAAGKSRTLYKRRTRTDGSGTGLEELAEVVASSGAGSGLTGSGLSSSHLRADGSHAPETADPNRLPMILLAAGVAIVSLLAVVLWYTVGRSKPASPANAGEGVAAESGAASGADLTPRPSSRYAEPNFCGIKLDVPVTIYVLDRGNGTRDVFDSLKEATYRSIQSLGSDRKFQIVFWDNGKIEGYPPGLPTYATASNLATCRSALQDVAAFNQSDPIPSLRKAIGNRPAVIVLVTGKGSELDADLPGKVATLLKGSPAKIHTVAIGDVDSAVLRQIATAAGGQYKSVTAAKLRDYGE